MAKKDLNGGKRILKSYGLFKLVKYELHLEEIPP